ncbi:MAG: homoaconitase [Planctomycetes bacterium]|nr:homoaconitase [Planctomycetota bacterium]
MPQTLIEKTAQLFAVGLPANHEVHAGDFLTIRPAHVMTHDNSAAVIGKFRSVGAKRVFDPSQPVFALDHDIQNTTVENLAKYARIQAFANEHGIAFYPAGRGIGHQVMVEEGFVLPGTFVVGSDSHSNLYGALGALGTPVVRTDAAAIWATGQTWWQVPDVVRARLTGRLQPGVVGKDVIVALCGVFNHDEVLNCCIEFDGPGAASLSIEERLTISNMTTEWGALAGVFPYDERTRDFLLERAEEFERRGDAKPRLTPERIDRLEADLPIADVDAWYAKELELDLSAVTPFVSGPNTVKTIAALPEIEQQDVRINKAYLMSCVNARLQDFESAAEVVRGRHVAAGVEFYIAAASDEVERQARARGFWQTLVDAGAIELPPGCGACIGLGRGTLEAGEVGISATNRNFKGRMGSRDASVYLASPAVVAASAIAGKIASPQSVAASDAPPQSEREALARDSAPNADRLRDAEEPTISKPSSNCYEAMRRASSFRMNEPRAKDGPAPVQILPGFPERIEGELLFLPADNLDTDGIYGKDYTYKEGMTPEEMAGVAMENYDPAFQQIAREGDILVGGYNFGTGSSREQAATALKYRGLQMIIAGSFSQTYKRNAFNNGYICIECPALVDELKDAFENDKTLTIRSGATATVDFTRSEVSVAPAPEPRASARAVSPEMESTSILKDSRPRGLKSAALRYPIVPLGEVAQELIVKGGFASVIREQLAARTS